MKQIIYLFIAVIICLTIACDQRDFSEVKSLKKPIRYGMVTGLNPDKVAYYKELHANAWEGVLQALKASHVQNYSIYIQRIRGEYFLFSYYEYTGDNYEEDMKKIAADTTTQRWWRETDPCQLPLPDAAAKQIIWTSMEEVFHMN